MIEKTLWLFRIIIPSWRFFDELGDITPLYYRQGKSQEKLGDWVRYSITPKRNLGTLLLNPKENLYLAHIRLISELPQSEPLVKNIVQSLIENTDSRYFQFKAGDFVSPLMEKQSP